MKNSFKKSCAPDLCFVISFCCEFSCVLPQLKMTVKDSSSGSGDLSKANRELRQRASELECLVSKQKACIKEQRSQLRQQQKSGSLQDNSQKVEVG